MTLYIDMDNTLYDTYEATEIYANKFLAENPEILKKYRDIEYQKIIHRRSSVQLTDPFPENMGIPSQIRIERRNLPSNSTTSWMESARLPEELSREIRVKLFYDVEYWTNIPLMINAYEVMEKLCKRHDVFIATSVFLSNSEECYIGKPRCIKKTLPFFDIQKLIYTHFKYNLRGDCIIEDVLSQVLPFRGMKIIMSYPYNNIESTSLDANIYRVHSWKEIEALLL